MHNVPPDQIQKNIRLTQLVQKYPCIYNPAVASSSGGEALETAWEKIAQEFNESVEVTKKKWRLLRSSLLRYLKVFKDKSTSKGNSYRPYYLLKYMEFLLPYIDDKAIVKRVIKEKKPSVSLIVKKEAQRTVPEEHVNYTTITSSPNGMTYSVTQVEGSPTISKPSTSDSVKSEIHQDIQQFYNQAHHHAVVSSTNVKILDENFIYQQQGNSETQLITYDVQQQESDDQPMEETTDETQQEDGHEDCITEELHDSQDQDQEEHMELHETSTPIKGEPNAQTSVTTIPIPHFNTAISCGSMTPGDTADIYFLIGLLPDFRSVSPEKKRKLKISILKMIDDAISE